MLMCVNIKYITMIMLDLGQPFVATLPVLGKHDIVSLFTLLYTGLTAIMDNRRADLNTSRESAPSVCMKNRVHQI